jgi:hypothetical protein
MSKGVKMVVGVAAAIAIPFAAPYIAGAIGASLGITAASFGMSAAVGATLGSAAVGAALGATASAVLGQDIGRGALMGGIGGGIGGYLSGAEAVTAVPGSGSSLSSMGGGTGLVGTPEATFGVDSIGANLGGGSYLTTPTATTGTGLSSGFSTGTGMGGGTGLTLPGSGYTAPMATFAGAPESTFASVPESTFATGPTTGATTGATTGSTAGMGGGTGLTMPASYTSSAGLSGTTAGVSELGGGAGLRVPTSMAGTGAEATSAIAGTAATKPTTFMEALKALPGEIASKFSDPKTLADLTLRAAGQLAGSAAAGDGLSSEERTLLDTQTQELKDLQKNNVALFNERIEQARGLIGESKYFDPEYFGLQRARRAQIAGATAKRAGLRGLEGGRRAAEGRRFDLATGRDTGTAFDQGFGTGVQGQLATTQAGLNMYPTSYPSSMGDYTNLSRAYGVANERTQTAQKQIGSLFGSLTGRVEDNTPARRA